MAAFFSLGPLLNNLDFAFGNVPINGIFMVIHNFFIHLQAGCRVIGIFIYNSQGKPCLILQKIRGACFYLKEIFFCFINLLSCLGDMPQGCQEKIFHTRFIFKQLQSLFIKLKGSVVFACIKTNFCKFNLAHSSGTGI